MATTTSAGDGHRVTVIIGYDKNKKHLIIRHPTDSSTSASTSTNGQNGHNSLLPLRKRFKTKLRKTCATECGICKSKSGHYTTVFKLGDKKGTRKCWDCCRTTQVRLQVKFRSPAPPLNSGSIGVKKIKKQNAQT